MKKAGTDFAEAKEKLDGIRVDYKIKEEALEQEKKEQKSSKRMKKIRKKPKKN